MSDGSDALNFQPMCYPGAKDFTLAVYAIAITGTILIPPPPPFFPLPWRKTPSYLPGVGQNIAVHASPAAKILPFVSAPTAGYCDAEIKFHPVC